MKNMKNDSSSSFDGSNETDGISLGRNENEALEAQGSSGTKSMTIDESTLIKFRNNLFEAIEELRIQRNLEEENEERIRSLMTEKQELERIKDEVVSKNAYLLEQHAQNELDIKKRHEDRLSQYEDEKTKQAVAIECTEKELKVLKDEIRALHLVKYSLEKKIKEQERLIQLQNSARDSHESQMTALEQRSRAALDECTRLADLVERTESNFSVVSRLHRKLIYTNEHQKCLLESHEKDVESKTLELVALKAAISQRRDSLASKSHETVNRESALERELRMKTDMCEHSQRQLDETRQENKKLVESLEAAHKLLDRHVLSINKHNEIEAVVHLELDEIKTENKALKETLNKNQDDNQMMENTLRCHKEESAKLKQVLESRLEDLQKQHDSLSEAHNSLEQLNSNCSQKNMEQRTKIEAMIKEEDELGKRLNQTEETLEKMRETNDQLKKNLQAETSSLTEKLLQVERDHKDQLERANSLEKEKCMLTETIKALKAKIEFTEEKNTTIKSKEQRTTACQTEHEDVELISSLTEKLSKAEQMLRSETDRSHTLEVQCSVLNGKMEKLELESVKDTEMVTVGVQTDNKLKGYLQKTRNEALASCEDSDKYNQQQEEEMNNCVSQIEETLPGTDEKQVFDHSKQQKNQNRQVRRNNERMDQGTERNESLPFSKVEMLSTDAVIDTSSDSQTGNKGLPKKTMENCKTKSKLIANESLEGISRIIPDTNVLSLEAGQEPTVTETEAEVFQSSPVFTRKDRANETDPNRSVTSLAIPNKGSPVIKKVRLHLESSEDPTHSEEPDTQKQEIPKEDPQILFSDEEDAGKEPTSIDEDVSRRISRIQNLLKNDRLRTNRKRKNPVV
ncbi:coiled-coil domain-containing protein 73-like [Acropora muricata]|uniref:coiled-coil domain-containing protein 73-like n=1 Tax=Acropora muricata TaxID=159855 RepID=UPI0034E51D43